MKPPQDKKGTIHYIDTKVSDSKGISASKSVAFGEKSDSTYTNGNLGHVQETDISADIDIDIDSSNSNNSIKGEYDTISGIQNGENIMPAGVDLLNLDRDEALIAMAMYEFGVPRLFPQHHNPTPPLNKDSMKSEPLAHNESSKEYNIGNHETKSNENFNLEDSENSQNRDTVSLHGSSSTQCPECGITFKSSSSLRSHRKTHSAKMYQCKDCKLPFSRSHDLRRHEFTHTLAKPFVCEGCGRAFSRRDALKRHTNAMSKRGGCAFKNSKVSPQEEEYHQN